MDEPTLFSCDVCGKEFSTSLQLSGHMTSHKREQNKLKAEDAHGDTQGDKPEMTLSEHPQPKNLTAEESALFQRIAGETQDWETVDEGDMLDFSLSADPLLLPPEAKKLQDEKKFAFRWAERKPERIDSLRSVAPPLRWMIVNKTTCPWLNSKDIDPVLGCVPRLDQMLMFKPWSWHRRVQQAKMDLAEAASRTGDLKSRNGMRDDRKKWMAGEEHGISSSDEVIADEAVYDRAMGLKDDTSELGDTFE